MIIEGAWPVCAAGGEGPGPGSGRTITDPVSRLMPVRGGGLVPPGDRYARGWAWR